MNKRQRQLLIDPGVSNWYQHVILIIVTGVGLLYVLNILPAFDPAILQVPRSIVYAIYMGLAIGGIAVYLGFLAAIWDKVLSLRVQLFGLAVQALSTAAISVAVLAYAGFAISLFILLFAVPISVMHLVRIRFVLREIRNAPLKETIVAAYAPGSISVSQDTGGDKVLETMLYLKERATSGPPAI